MDVSGPEDEGGVPPAEGADEGRSGGLTGFPRHWGTLVVPDDVGALTAEIAAVRRQLARERWSDRYHRAVPGWARSAMRGPAAPIVGVALLVAVAFTALLAVLVPSGGPLARPVPLAVTTVLSGRDGGLLPDVQLTDALGSPFPLRDLRPGVVLLVGDHCDCESLVTEYVNATAEAHVRLLVVGDRLAAGLPAHQGSGRVMAASDPTARLSAALPHGGVPAAVLVRADGVIDRFTPDARNVVSLRTELGALR